MADLEKIARLMNIDINITQETNKKHSPIGKKRRSWLMHEENIERNQIQNNLREEKGVYKQHLSTSSINTVDKLDLENRVSNTISKKIEITVENLRGNPLRLVKLLFSIVDSKNERITKKITVSEIVKNLEISKDSARTALRFLLKNNFISRIKFQVGKLGWSQYSVNSILFTELVKEQKKGAIDPF